MLTKTKSFVVLVFDVVQNNDLYVKLDWNSLCNQGIQKSKEMLKGYWISAPWKGFLD